jgi:ABC-2 type transport system permease protein
VAQWRGDGGSADRRALVLRSFTFHGRAFVESILYLVLIGLLGLGLAAALRSSVAATATSLGLLYLLPVVIQMFPDTDTQRFLYRLTPGTAGQALSTTVDVSALPIGPWPALGVVALWSVGALLLGAVVLNRRSSV